MPTDVESQDFGSWFWDSSRTRKVVLVLRFKVLVLILRFWSLRKRFCLWS